MSLQERLDQTGPLELKEILRIGMQTAAGLAAAHAQGLIHRDIKPANILLENGVERVKITDFGLARAVDDASLTQSGVVAGTPQYMSPEQARGEPVDPRTDLFSLGSVLYAMCTGRPPFRASGSHGRAQARLRGDAAADPRDQPRDPRLAGRDHRQAARQGPGRALPDGGRSRRAAGPTPGPPAASFGRCTGERGASAPRRNRSAGPRRAYAPRSRAVGDCRRGRAVCACSAAWD